MSVARLKHQKMVMDVLLKISQSKRFNRACGIVLATIFALFVYIHVERFIETGKLSLILVVISESLIIAFLIIRRDPVTVSTDPYDWLVAILGTFLPLFFRPASDGLLPQAEIVMAIGIAIQIAGVLSLNRSLALVAAKREIKTKWMYRLVRHPLYASYFMIYCCYVLVHTTLFNIIICVAAIYFLSARMFKEEKHLSLDPTYCDYMKQVRFRIIPYIF